MSGNKANMNGSKNDRTKSALPKKSTNTPTHQERLILASKLEKRLPNKNISDTDKQANQHLLCEHLSEVLIHNPSLAMRKDCSARLWRGCFYSNITQLRGAVSKAKRRGAAGGDTKEVEKRLFEFLNEAIKLYSYLVGDYEKKLTNSDSGVGVVPNLYRLLIYQGDLHRYKAEYNKSETFYLKASRLAPGRGNPYNQLAVVSQQSQSEPVGYPRTCVALYWYVRSLLATYEPFETSRPNMTRLFETNKAWLDKSILPSPPKDNGKNKKNFVDQQRQFKSILSRHFLSEFVHLHGMLFSSKTTPKPELIIQQAYDVTGNFRALLGEQAFGEALVFKMVAITVYSHTLPSKKSIALSCALKFGASLADVVSSHLKGPDGQTKSLSDIRTSNNKGGEIIPIKMLPPLLLLCEWIASLGTSCFTNVDNDAASFHERASLTFWEEICKTATHLRVLQENLRTANIQKFNGSFREHDIMKGFSAFTSFINHEPRSSYFSGDHEESYRGFLSPNDASESFLRYNANSNNNATTEAETKARIDTFFCCINKFMPSNENSECVFIDYDKGTKQYRLFDKKSLPQSPDINNEIYNVIAKSMDNECRTLKNTNVSTHDLLQTVETKDTSAQGDRENNDYFDEDEDVIVYSGIMDTKKDAVMNTNEIKYSVQMPAVYDQSNENVSSLIIPNIDTTSVPFYAAVLKPSLNLNRSAVGEESENEVISLRNNLPDTPQSKLAASSDVEDKDTPSVQAMFEDNSPGPHNSHVMMAPQSLPVIKLVQPPPGFGNIPPKVNANKPSPCNAYGPSSSFSTFPSALPAVQQLDTGIFPLAVEDSAMDIDSEGASRLPSSVMASIGINAYAAPLQNAPAPPPGFSHSSVPQSHLFPGKTNHVESLFFNSMEGTSSLFSSSNSTQKSENLNGDVAFGLKTSNPFAASSMPPNQNSIGGFDLQGFANNQNSLLGMSPFLLPNDADATKNTQGKQSTSQFVPSHATWNPFL